MLRRGAHAAGLDALVVFQRSLAGAATTCGPRQYATEDVKSDVATISTSLTNTGMRAGPGGRSSVSGVTATIFGATGFLGRYVAQALARQGSMVVYPYRCDDLDQSHLRIMGDLGQMVPLPDFSARDESAVRKAVSQSNVVINLIGSERETPRFKFEEVHVDIAQRIAQAIFAEGCAGLMLQAAADSGVERLIHVSCLGADANAPSRRLQTKATGDEAVRKAFPGATVLKPAVMIGTEDRIFNSYVSMAKNMPFVPVVGGGDARVQPVYVRDVTEAVVAALKFGDTAGKTFSLAGPRTFTRQQLVGLMFNTIREKYGGLHLPAGLALLMAMPREFLLRRGISIPMPTMFTEDYIREAMEDNVVNLSSGELSFADLGIQPQRIDVGLPIEHMRHHRVGGYDSGTTSGTEAAATA